jgi:hypothetical protein
MFLRHAFLPFLLVLVFGPPILSLSGPSDAEAGE